MLFNGNARKTIAEEIFFVPWSESFEDATIHERKDGLDT